MILSLNIVNLIVFVYRDGILFYLKQGHYAMDLSPLVLLWKDSHCSRFFASNEPTSVVLLVKNKGVLTTHEGVNVGQLSKETMLENKVYIYKFFSSRKYLKWCYSLKKGI